MSIATTPRHRRPGHRACSLAAAIAVATLLIVLGCSGDDPTPWRGGSPNVILISIDTLRADHLGVYDYERDTSPHLDSLAETSVVYRRAYAPTPWTLPSHAAMLTGTHPYLMDMRDRSSAVPESAPRLAALLSGLGYQTAAFVDSAPLDYVGAGRGFATGFDTYEHAHESVHEARPVYSATETVDRAQAWLSQRDPESPFFLFLHTKAVHSAPANAIAEEDYVLPYDCPRPWRFQFSDAETVEAALGPDVLAAAGGTNYLTRINSAIRSGRPVESVVDEARTQAIIDLYDGCIAAVDAQLGRLFESLNAQGLLDETLVVVTSDHGESFLEHGMMLHGQTYEPLLHVPLIVRFPRWREGLEIGEPVELMDIAPTIAAVLETPIEGMTGRILAGLPGVPEAEARDHFSYYLRAADKPETGQYALRSDALRLVRNPPTSAGDQGLELFGLDAGSEIDLPLEGDRLPVLQEQLRSNIRAPSLYSETGVVEDPATLEHLKALGYVD